MRELSGGGSEMYRWGGCCGWGVIEERIRKDGRGEGGLELSPKLSTTMSKSASAELGGAKLKEESRRIGRRWGGSIDIVRAMGSRRRGDRVSREEGRTADDARGTADALLAESARRKATAGGSRYG